MGKFPVDPELQKKHDLESAIRTLEFLVEELEEGYQFDDTDSVEKIRLFKKAVETLKGYIDVEE